METDFGTEVRLKVPADVLCMAKVEAQGGGFEHPSLRNLVGVTSHAYWNAAEQSVEGLIEIYAAAQPVSALLDEILSPGEAAPDVGLSLVFYPRWEERKVVGVRHVESIDLVFEPAAEGRLLQALSAAHAARREADLEKEVWMMDGMET